ncbi:helix-turn-helix domain-containing protein [Paenibacillus faecis]|uniref:helix-turn-helix domain-containing protein n=1 Tax=Paenibacillus faecis TaxID=862114 RepID=UPI002011AD20|nr:helix-turn-helix domain-containing protein [Paenibacillus faecis]
MSCLPCSKEVESRCPATPARETLRQRRRKYCEKVATESGFDNLSYFSTVFKKLTGETPNAYRAKHNPDH